jgi:hypothetical protein
MADLSQETGEASREQLLYAGVLEKGMYIGLLILFITFIVYAIGIMPPHIPMDALPGYWCLPFMDYLHAADIPAGWGWVSLIGQGDFLNFIGIAILALVTIISYIAIIPLLLKKKDFLYAGIAVLEVIILSLAASGILVVGH